MKSLAEIMKRQHLTTPIGSGLLVIDSAQSGINRTRAAYIIIDDPARVRKMANGETIVGLVAPEEEWLTVIDFIRSTHVK